MSSEEEFTEFAMATSARLRRTAFLLCGDWHTTEDLVQSALATVFLSWRKIRRQDAAHAYAERTLLNVYLGEKASSGPERSSPTRYPTTRYCRRSRRHGSSCSMPSPRSHRGPARW